MSETSRLEDTCSNRPFNIRYRNKSIAKQAHWLIDFKHYCSLSPGLLITGCRSVCPGSSRAEVFALGPPALSSGLFVMDFNFCGYDSYHTVPLSTFTSFALEQPDSFKTPNSFCCVTVVVDIL